LHAAEAFHEVTLVAPDPSDGSATALAQGGIAAAVAAGDDPQSHAADTIAAGAGLSDPPAVRVLTEEAWGAIDELSHRGMVFDAGGAPTLEGGHSARRVLHAGGDATGWAILKMLLRWTRENHRIRWLGGRVSSLLVERNGVCGVVTDGAEEIEAHRVVLATGGATGIYSRRTGPARAIGEGMALAWDAGAALADLEFVQFHPTALDVPGHPARLLTEALRGEGAVLVDNGGRRFMPGFDERAELAPRDIVARAIAAVREETGAPIYLDATGIVGVSARFPTAAASCTEVDLDLGRDRIPVGPAAHYFTGGVFTDTWGRSTVPGLSACGEVACTGVHGANRLASNSLLEALVFGRRAALADEEGTGPVLNPSEPGYDPPGPADLPLDVVRSLSDRFLGVIRTGAELSAAASKLAGADGGGVPAATLVAWLVARAALRRTESRGGHYRRDFPEPRSEWRIRQAISRQGWSSIRVEESAP
jgi:L-aspartate oxidase